MFKCVYIPKHKPLALIIRIHEYACKISSLLLSYEEGYILTQLVALILYGVCEASFCLLCTFHKTNIP